jgi:hypothetical protein
MQNTNELLYTSFETNVNPYAGTITYRIYSVYDRYNPARGCVDVATDYIDNVTFTIEEVKREGTATIIGWLEEEYGHLRRTYEN